MCAHSLDRAHERGFQAMQFNFVVSTNEPAVHLWHSFGFEIVGRLPGAFSTSKPGLRRCPRDVSIVAINVRGRLPARALRAKSLDNLFAVEAPVLDEDFARVSPANHDSCQMNSRNIALQRVGVKRRLARYGIEVHS